MKPTPILGQPRGRAREKLLDAALRLIRERGFAACSVDDLCADAGVTKGAFFHHFPSKEALGVAAAQHWSTTTERVFVDAPYQQAADPFDRILGYLDLRAWMIGGDTSKFTCLAGTLAQEVHLSHPAVRDAAGTSISDHAARLAPDLAAAIRRHAPDAGLDALSLAMHIQTVMQGAFVMAKAQADSAIAVESIGHLRRYLCLLLGVAEPAADPAATNSNNAAMRSHLESLFWTQHRQ